MRCSILTIADDEREPRTGALVSPACSVEHPANANRMLEHRPEERPDSERHQPRAMCSHNRAELVRTDDLPRATDAPDLGHDSRAVFSDVRCHRGPVNGHSAVELGHDTEVQLREGAGHHIQVSEETPSEESLSCFSLRCVEVEPVDGQGLLHPETIARYGATRRILLSPITRLPTRDPHACSDYGRSR